MECWPSRKGIGLAKEYDIHLPRSDNDGVPIEKRKIRQVGALLLEFFGAVTFFPQENKGWWTMQGVTFRDSIVIYRVVTNRTKAARAFLRKLKEELKRDVRQEEILIVEKEARTI